MSLLEPLKQEIRKLEEKADLKEGDTICLHYWTCCTFASFIKCYEQAVQNGTMVVELKESRIKQGEFLAQTNTRIVRYNIWMAISKIKQM